MKRLMTALLLSSALAGALPVQPPPATLGRAVVQRQVDPATLQVTYDYATQTLRLSGVKLPPEGSRAYSLAAAMLRDLAPSGSVLHVEPPARLMSTGATPTDLWQGQDLVALIMVECGLMTVTGEGKYAAELAQAQARAKARGLGVWAN